MCIRDSIVRMQTAYDFYKLLDYPVRRLAVQYGSHWYNIGFYRYGYQWLHCVYVISLGNENTIIITYVNAVSYTHLKVAPPQHSRDQ